MSDSGPLHSRFTFLVACWFEGFQDNPEVTNMSCHRSTENSSKTVKSEGDTIRDFAVVQIQCCSRSPLKNVMDIVSTIRLFSLQ